MGKEMLSPKEIRTLKTICRLFDASNQQKVNVKALVKTKIAFTDRELLVIRMTCEEHKAEQIAEKLGLTERTVEKAKTEIFRKTKTKSSVALVKFAIKNGIYQLN